MSEEAKHDPLLVLDICGLCTHFREGDHVPFFGNCGLPGLNYDDPRQTNELAPWNSCKDFKGCGNVFAEQAAAEDETVAVEVELPNPLTIHSAVVRFRDDPEDKTT